MIRDLCVPRAMSVTNDAEYVVEHLAKAGLLPAGRRLFYYDSEDQFDEIRVVDGKFAGFGPGMRCRRGKPGHERWDQGLPCGIHCDAWFDQMVTECRSRSW